MDERRMTPRERALYDVQVHAFEAKELQLFLDTHADDREAGRALGRALRLEQETAGRYEEAYGPLTVNSAVCGGLYRWASNPWPWEREE